MSWRLRVGEFFRVESLDKSMQRCTKLGGRIIAGPNNMVLFGRYCVIKDPAGLWPLFLNRLLYK